MQYNFNRKSKFKNSGPLTPLTPLTLAEVGNAAFSSLLKLRNAFPMTGFVFPRNLYSSSSTHARLSSKWGRLGARITGFTLEFGKVKTKSSLVLISYRFFGVRFMQLIWEIDKDWKCELISSPRKNRQWSEIGNRTIHLYIVYLSKNRNGKQKINFKNESRRSTNQMTIGQWK